VLKNFFLAKGGRHNLIQKLLFETKTKAERFYLIQKCAQNEKWFKVIVTMKFQVLQLAGFRSKNLWQMPQIHPSKYF
jgi:hypothetical protein